VGRLILPEPDGKPCRIWLCDIAGVLFAGLGIKVAGFVGRLFICQLNACVVQAVID